MDLAIDPDFAHATRNELRVLGTEIQNQDAMGVNIVLCHSGGFRTGNSALPW
jgi:hypothetical protein